MPRIYVAHLGQMRYGHEKPAWRWRLFCMHSEKSADCRVAPDATQGQSVKEAGSKEASAIRRMGRYFETCRGRQRRFVMVTRKENDQCH